MKTINLQPITINELDALRFYPNGDGSWRAEMEYHVIDQSGSRWKSGKQVFQSFDSATPLITLVNAGLSAINAAEGLS
jgi:hypothetical protein